MKNWETYTASDGTGAEVEIEAYTPEEAAQEYVDGGYYERICSSSSPRFFSKTMAFATAWPTWDLDVLGRRPRLATWGR